MSRSSENDGLIDSDITKTPKPFIYEGFFAYSDGGEGEYRIAFLIEAQEEGGNFSGVASDIETAHLFAKDAVKIKGFVENGLISFIKTYPYGYFVNENGETEIDPRRKQHTIEYSGNWIEEEAKFAGTYIVTTEEIWTDRYKGEYKTLEYEDYWEMKPSEATKLCVWPWIFSPAPA